MTQSANDPSGFQKRAVRLDEGRIVCSEDSDGNRRDGRQTGRLVGVVVPLIPRAVDRLCRIRVDRHPTVEKCVGECDPTDGRSRSGHDSECGRRDQNHDQPLATVAAERHALPHTRRLRPKPSLRGYRPRKCGDELDAFLQADVARNRAGAWPRRHSPTSPGRRRCARASSFLDRLAERGADRVGELVHARLAASGDVENLPRRRPGRRRADSPSTTLAT